MKIISINYEKQSHNFETAWTRFNHSTSMKHAREIWFMLYRLDSCSKSMICASLAFMTFTSIIKNLIVIWDSTSVELIISYKEFVLTSSSLNTEKIQAANAALLSEISIDDCLSISVRNMRHVLLEDQSVQMLEIWFQRRDRLS